MKCKELQIGDWIQDKDGYPMQITSVGEDYACANFNVFREEDNQPESIEITEDILKHNKWEVQGYTLLPSEHYYIKDEGGNHLLWNHGTLSIWLACGEDNDGVFSDAILPCKYVHQLQQALRLAGLSEIADNFKI